MPDGRRRPRGALTVAYASPLPPERSGVADYSALLLPALRDRLDVVVLERDARRLPRADVALYHLGNNAETHAWIVELLRRRPGMVVLHDFVLHHLIAGMTVGRGDADGYIAAMHAESGVIGRLLAYGVVEGLVPPLWQTRPDEFPLVRGVLDLATAVIVHSRYTEEQVHDAGYRGPVWRIPMPAWPADDLVAQTDEPLLGGRSPVFACLGNLNPAKRVPQLLEAFARVLDRQPNAGLVLAGSRSPGVDVDHYRERLGDALSVHDFLEEPKLWRILAACDVLVTLRFPTMGETSGMAVRALSLGKPLVVSDIGWFSELPDTVAAKVPVDAWEVDTLAAVLELLARDAPLRARMSRAAADYARTEHELNRVADLYVAAIEETAGREAVRNEVLREIAVASAEVGLRSGDAELEEIAARAREIGLGR